MNVPIERKRKVDASKKNLSCYQKQPSDCVLSEEILISEEEEAIQEESMTSKKAKISSDISDSNKCKKCEAPLKKRHYFYCVDKCAQENEIMLSQVFKNGIEINVNGVEHRRIIIVTSSEKECNQNHDNVKISIKIEKIQNNSSTCALYNYFGQHNFMLVGFERNISKKIIQDFLTKPLLVIHNSKRLLFSYFGQSPSQLRKKVCVIYNTELGDRQSLLKKFGNFDKIKDIAKYSARVGLLLSSSKKVLELEESNIDYDLPDIERNGFNFTDGCGLISIKLMTEITDKLNITSSYEHQKYKCPSVIQIRLNGCKGVLSTWENMTERKIKLRKSLVKFEWTKKEPYILGICDDGISRPYTYGYLNKQFICILSANGIPDDVLLSKQKLYFSDMDSLLFKMDVALRYLYFWNRYDLAEKLMQIKHLNDQRCVDIRLFLKEKKKKFISNQFREEDIITAGKEKKSDVEGLKIPIEKSLNVFGIADSSNTLMSGECFFQPTINGQSKIFHDIYVVVLKCPSYHPGDIKVLKCVDNTNLRHLYDCIVFPTNGDRPHPDEIAGSDLDGDKYFVCWDKDLVPLKTHNPTSYIGNKSKYESQITEENLVKFFSFYDASLVGLLNNLWCKWCDLEGVLSSKCLLLANLFSRAIDAAKTGESLKIPNELRKIPTNVDDEKNFVWKVMISNARYYLQESFRQQLNTPKEFSIIDDSTLYQLIEQKSLLIDDYRLFRSLYKYLFDMNDKKHLFYQLIYSINFDFFTSRQIKDILIDCPLLCQDFLSNSLLRSKILPKKFAKSIQFDNQIAWSLYHSSENDLNWYILNDFMEKKCNKLLVFEFDVYGVKRVIVLFVNYRVCSEACTNHLDSAVAIAYMCIGNSMEMYRREIGQDFTWLLSMNRLQLFIGVRSRTFVNFMFNDENDCFENIMSVALDFFDTKLPTRLPKLRREKCLRIELYSDIDLKEPFYKQPSFDLLIQNDKIDKKDQNNNDFKFIAEEFPEPSESRNKTNKVVKTQRREQFEELKVILIEKLNKNEQSCQEMEQLINLYDNESFISYEIINLVIYLLSRGCFFQQLDSYKICFLYLIKLAPNSKEFQRQWLDKCFTLLESMKQNNMFFTINQIDDLICDILFSQAYSKDFTFDLLKLIKKGCFRIENDLNNFNINYFSYWLSLLTMDLLTCIEEVEDISKKKEIITKGDLFRIDEENNESNKHTLWKLNLNDSSLIFSQTDCISFTPLTNDCQSTKYSPIAFANIVKQTGLIYDIYFIWPTGFIPDTKTVWRVDKFTGFIPFRRQIDSLKLQTNEANDLSQFLMKSWYHSIDSNSDNNSINLDIENDYNNLNRKSCNCNQKIGVNEFFFLKEGNASQKEAVNLSQSNAISLIHGPPGTGKTEVACEIIAQWNSKADEKILVVAETNEAVNNIMKKLISKNFDKEKILRIGLTDKLDAVMNQYSLEKIYCSKHGSKNINEYGMQKKNVVKIINKSRVVFTTCSSSMLTYLDGINFKYLLVDEAAQVFEPALMMPLSRGCEVICLIGDHKQLPPLVKNESNKIELSKSLFERLLSLSYIKKTMLNVQYRMHPDIAAFSSREFYDGRLENGLVTQTERKGLIFPGEKFPTSIRFKDVYLGLEKNLGSSKQNKMEADSIKELIICIKSIDKTIRDEHIGIITAYSAQVKLLKEILKGFNITINTVDGFQGQEREIILYSAVRANNYQDVGFLDDERRFNVTMTRAKRLLVVVGNRKTLVTSRLWQKWIDQFK
ncbi:unnamed protein product [Brachionus calyciflorus]|uniref:Helicase ATP-binding domain-containing protein n=1 Tax=Brachionus calyciflorus TaxID=104777 RepID=A0A813M7H4_9BILA|nr:unnamed protein product [Brachionus calyciflorus]